MATLTESRVIRIDQSLSLNDICRRLALDSVLWLNYQIILTLFFLYERIIGGLLFFTGRTGRFNLSTIFH